MNDSTQNTRHNPDVLRYGDGPDDFYVRPGFLSADEWERIKTAARDHRVAQIERFRADREEQ